MSDSESKKNKNPLLFLLVLINTGFILFILGQQFKLGDEVDKLTRKESNFPSEAKLLPHLPKPSENKVISNYELGDFSANLARPSGPQRFLKTTIILIIETPKNNKLLETINKSSSIRDEVIALLNKQTPRDVLKLEGRDVLKNIIKTHLNKLLKEDQVRRILFTKFTVN